MRSFALSALASVVLLGCGGGSSSGASDSHNDINNPSAFISQPGVFSGKIAGGNLVGATVCLDYNHNAKCDADEPATRTEAGGRYDLKVSKANAAQARFIAEISADTVNADTNEAVEIPYILSAPAGHGAFISPLSTLIDARMYETELPAKQVMEEVARELKFDQQESLLADYNKYIDSAPEKFEDYERIISAMTYVYQTNFNPLHIKIGNKKVTLSVLSALIQENLKEILRVASSYSANPPWTQGKVDLLDRLIQTDEKSLRRLITDHSLIWRPMSGSELKEKYSIANADNDIWVACLNYEGPCKTSIRVTQDTMTLQGDGSYTLSLSRYSFEDGQWQTSPIGALRSIYYLDNGQWRYAATEESKYYIEGDSMIMQQAENHKDSYRQWQRNLEGTRIADIMDRSIVELISDPNATFNPGTIQYVHQWTYAKGREQYNIEANGYDSWGKEECDLPGRDPGIICRNNVYKNTDEPVLNLSEIFTSQNTDSNKLRFNLFDSYFGIRLIREGDETRGKAIYSRYRDTDIEAEWQYETHGDIRLVKVTLPKTVLEKNTWPNRASHLFFTELQGQVRSGLVIAPNTKMARRYQYFNQATVEQLESLTR